MPKLKTRKAMAKRVKITKHGKALHWKAGRRHLLAAKKTNRKRKLRHAADVPGVEMQVVRRSLPYGM